MEDYDEFIDKELYDAWQLGFVRGLFVGTFVTACISGFIGLTMCH